MTLKGTKTANNLMHAFAGESQARNRYTYYASIAKKEGYVQIQNIFLETANQEKEHAKRLMKFLNKDLAVMDSTAASLCKDNSLEIIVFNMNKYGNIVKAIKGEKIGTHVKK